ncbi:hypothetical protein F4779DRAFT_605461, partial [Xylariaceae sp. FL0662B]
FFFFFFFFFFFSPFSLPPTPAPVPPFSVPSSSFRLTLQKLLVSADIQASELMRASMNGWCYICIHAMVLVRYFVPFPHSSYYYYQYHY